MKKRIGEWMLGEHMCRVYVDTNKDGGHAMSPRRDTPYVVMTVGLDSNWRDVFSTLLHEAFEQCVTTAQLSFEPVSGYRFNTAIRLFVIDHQQFDEHMQRTGHFAAQVAHPLHDAWRAWQKEKRKRSKA